MKLIIAFLSLINFFTKVYAGTSCEQLKDSLRQARSDAKILVACNLKNKGYDSNPRLVVGGDACIAFDQKNERIFVNARYKTSNPTMQEELDIRNYAELFIIDKSPKNNLNLASFKILNPNYLNHSVATIWSVDNGSIEIELQSTVKECTLFKRSYSPYGKDTCVRHKLVKKESSLRLEEKFFSDFAEDTHNFEFQGHHLSKREHDSPIFDEFECKRVAKRLNQPSTMTRNKLNK